MNLSKSPIILWNFWLSSASWRVRIALNLKKIEYEYKSVNIIKKDEGEQFSSFFTKLNPKQEVPLLLIDGKYMTQSLPIIEYLNETRPNHFNLIPSDPYKRQRSKTIAEIINSGIQPYQNINVLKRIGDANKNEWLNHYLNKGLNSIEAILKETSGKYCIDNEISIADLCLVPQYNACQRYQIDLSNYKLINKIVAELNQIPEFENSHAYRQIDTAEKFRLKEIK